MKISLTQEQKVQAIEKIFSITGQSSDPKKQIKGSEDLHKKRKGKKE